MNIPENCLFTQSHEWVLFLEDGSARVGLSDYAQGQLGDLVFVNLPQEGDRVTAGEALGDVESVKAVSDVYAPVSGTVAAVNQELLDHPEAINADPYGAWLIQVADPVKGEGLMDAAAYRALVESL